MIALRELWIYVRNFVCIINIEKLKIIKGEEERQIVFILFVEMYRQSYKLEDIEKEDNLEHRGNYLMQLISAHCNAIW